LELLETGFRLVMALVAKEQHAQLLRMTGKGICHGCKQEK
jgi:hypothetical protein